MLTAEGCRQRRQRFWDAAGFPNRVSLVVLSDPTHLRYLANCYISPISLGGDATAALILARDGSTKLIHDNRVPSSVKLAHVDEQVAAPWYDGQSPAHGPRQLAYAALLPAPPCDLPGQPFAEHVVTTLADMRRRKDPDEVEVLRACCRAGEAGQAWALANTRAGMSELDAYAGVSAACNAVVGEHVIVYGDFAVSPGPARHGGPPTRRVLVNGDLVIFDFSVIIAGYRSDFTNTVCVGSEPTAGQSRLMQLSQQAMAAGERKLRAGASCQEVYDAVRGSYEAAGMADWFPHHAGHGLGLTHPEAPYIVRHSTETLLAGDVVTLEPGLYVEDVGGVRIEHNYLITDAGFERLSQHKIGLVP